MIKRLVTGFTLAGILVLAFFLREFNPIYFDIPIMLMIIISTYELIRIFKDKLNVPTIVVIFLFVLGLYPVYLFLGGVYSVMIFAVAMFVVQQCILLFSYAKQKRIDNMLSQSEENVSQSVSQKDLQTQKNSVNTSLEPTLYFMFMLFYPILMLVMLLEINHASAGLMGLLLAVGIASFCDTFAFFAGITFKGKKLCPNISPKKTIAGAIGGLVGGTLSAVAIWAFVEYVLGSSYQIVLNINIPVWVAVMIVGFVGSILSQFGDLAASCLKRKAGIKDFGSLFPGHGGVLDRLDGILFNTVLVFAFFKFFVV